MMTTSASLGEEIKRAREARGMSASELATRAAVNRLTLRELETGTGNPRLSTLLAVCHVLDLDLKTLPSRLTPMVASDDNLRPSSLNRLLIQKRKRLPGI
jgi:transcriptional regulator with XRE-family HTH domain